MRRVSIGQLALHAPSEQGLLTALDELIDGGGQHFVVFCEAHLFVRASRDRELRELLSRASLVLPDGVSMTAGARLLGRRFEARLPGPVLMPKILAHGVRRGRRHFFYGGAEGVAEEMAARLGARIPGLQVVGCFAPPFRPLSSAEEAAVKERIEASNADVVWVGLGAPKQERWMASQLGSIDVPLMLGVGAAFDFHSGVRKWAPAWVRRAGLEWIYRTATGGARVRKRNIKHVAAFAALIARLSLARRLGRD